ncbi:hypothetical protein BCR43DRAFT_19078 [Syncephalastrum racemosum]|uniref:Uncharacterized protein n=1 Tax=Syncephalastrum racemosum TaxID=13706 RepID=A0A1X2HSZ2_SYNRA|nr:hypothetical protein BCR43DRAFT_19078 [Syncephalastrum racemosum]
MTFLPVEDRWLSYLLFILACRRHGSVQDIRGATIESASENKKNSKNLILQTGCLAWHSRKPHFEGYMHKGPTSRNRYPLADCCLAKNMCDSKKQ